ncbi:hypothetical protein QUA56_26070 [Microcoleus sp. N3A4]|uniref:hypothetical protein n=1 Tax=Microcoleus sp. N3A4 TaxID=3055379 RepID=UPI002FD5E197
MPCPTPRAGHGIAVSYSPRRARHCRVLLPAPDTALPCPTPRAGHGIAVSLQMLAYFSELV